MPLLHRIAQLLSPAAGPGSSPEPPELRRPWTGDMVLRTAGTGKTVRYPRSSYGAVKVEWVSRRLDDQGRPVQVRVPSEITRIYALESGFTAAGKHYDRCEQLYAQADRRKIWCRDIYGREVLYLAERFPCFDSSDFLTENRFFRWFFLREGQRLTRVFYTDETDKIYVTEDVANLEHRCWQDMEREGYFQ